MSLKVFVCVCVCVCCKVYSNLNAQSLQTCSSQVLSVRMQCSQEVDVSSPSCEAGHNFPFLSRPNTPSSSLHDFGADWVFPSPAVVLCSIHMLLCVARAAH